MPKPPTIRSNFLPNIRVWYDSVMYKHREDGPAHEVTGLNFSFQAYYLHNKFKGLNGAALRNEIIDEN